MKKQVISLLLTLVLAVCVNTSLADGTGPRVAIIDGKTSDRVHLRKEPSAKADSLGLYFTGTEALCDSSTGGEWTWITVGTESGYMKTEYLSFGDNPSSIKPKQPVGVVTNIKTNSWVNIRFNPMQKSENIGTLFKDDTVTIMGETATKWYYINSRGVNGYVMADFLLIIEASDSASHNVGGSSGGSSSSTGTLTPGTSDWSANMGTYQDVLQNRTKLYSTDSNKRMFVANLGDAVTDGQFSISAFAVVDLDNDGTPEVVLSESVDGNEYYGFEVLRSQGNVVYGYHFEYRALMGLKHDGTFSFSSGAADNGYGRAAFTDNAYQINPIAYVQSSANGSISYVVDQKAATQEQFQSAIGQQAAKPDISWYFFTDENVGAMNLIFG